MVVYTEAPWGIACPRVFSILLHSVWCSVMRFDLIDGKTGTNSGGSGYLSQNSLPLEFGLGATTTIDSLIIRWSGGIVEVLTSTPKMPSGIYSTTAISVDQVLEIVEGESLVAVDDGESLPASFRLYANIPNPFSETTIIRFALPARVPVSIRMYDVRGRLVRTLIEREDLPPGRHELTWDTRTNTGQRSEAGIYFYVMRAGDFRAVRRLVLLR